MTERDSEKSFKPLRGFINGEERDEPIYFAYSASLRIFGDELPLDEITRELGVQPTHTQRKGERRKPTSKTAYRDDAWFFESSLPETEELHRHIDEVWKALKPHAEYLKELKKRFKVDIFCGYRSNCDHAGIEGAGFQPRDVHRVGHPVRRVDYRCVNRPAAADNRPLNVGPLADGIISNPPREMVCRV